MKKTVDNRMGTDDTNAPLPSRHESKRVGDSKLKTREAKKLISQMAKVLGHLGGSAKRNRSHESWVAMARAGGLARGKKIREQKARLAALLQEMGTGEKK